MKVNFSRVISNILHSFSIKGNVLLSAKRAKFMFSEIYTEKVKMFKKNYFFLKEQSIEVFLKMSREYVYYSHKDVFS